MRRYRGLAIMAGIFIAGVVVGSFGAPALKRWWFPRTPEAMEQRIMNRLTRTLKLDDAQQAAVRPILHGFSQELSSLKKTHRTQVDAARRAAGDQIRLQLTPEQAEAYDRLRQEVERKRRRRVGIDEPVAQPPHP